MTYSPEIPVNFINMNTNKLIPLRLLLDTGATSTIVEKKYAKQLGIIDVESGQITNVMGVEGESKGKDYRHFIGIQIGNLDPIVADVVFSDNPIDDRKGVVGAESIMMTPVGLLGWQNALSKYSITVLKDKITFTELPKSVLKNVKVIRKFNTIVVSV